MPNAPSADPVLLIVIASTRPGRVGLPVGRWFEDRARAHGGFRVTVADLAELRLPLLDEPNHPIMRKYTKSHTREWSEIVDGADAFVFVMPEYNYSFTAPLKNALDYLHFEWNYKPIGLVSYGGVSAGSRAAAALKAPLSALRLYPVAEAITIPFVAKLIDDDGVLQPNEVMNQTAQAMLEELLRTSNALAVLRGGEAGAG
jgi:NAD(P)H-dependent FMN reductase